MKTKNSIEESRSTIKFYLDRGMRPADIFRLLKKYGVTRNMVYRTADRLRETGSISDRKRSGAPRTARTPAMVKRLRARISRNPRRSQTSLAKSMKTSRRSVQRALKEDLGLTAYRKRRVHGLTELQARKRLDRSRELLSRHAGENLEKLFSPTRRCSACKSATTAKTSESTP